MKFTMTVILTLFSANAKADKIIVKRMFPPKVTCIDESNLSILGDSYRPVESVGFLSIGECEKSQEFEKALADITVEREERIRSFTLKYPKFKKFEADAIKFKVQVGMPEELVFLIWGKPSRVNEIRSETSIRKQLVFADILYIYIENHSVVAIQWLSR